MRMKFMPIGWPLAVALVAGPVGMGVTPGLAQTVAPQPTSTVDVAIGRAEVVVSGDSHALKVIEIDGLDLDQLGA